MSTLAVTFFDVVLWIHLTAIVVALGPPFAYGLFFATAQRTSPRALPAVGRAMAAWDRTVGTLGALVILAAGIYLTADRWDFADFFVNWGIIAIIVLLGLSHGFFLPGYRRLTELAERDIEQSGEGEVRFSREFEQLSGRLATVGALVGIGVVVTIYVMTAKPFL